MKILITSASNPSAISLARTLSAENHEIYGSDEEPIWGTAPARWSRAYKHFFRSQNACTKEQIPYIDLVIPFGEHLDRVGELAREAGAALFSHSLFDHDFEFQDFVRRHVINKFDSVIKLPAAFRIHSTRCIAEILAHYPITTFSLQPTTCHDLAAYDTDEDDEVTLVDASSPTYASKNNTPANSLILSCLTLNEHTIDAIKSLNIVDRNPYRLIEVVEGGTSYSTHSIITAGIVRALLVTTPSPRADTLHTSPSPWANSDFTILPYTDPLFDVLSTFTQRFISTRTQHNSANGIFEKADDNINMHLTLHFRVKEEIRYGELVRRVTVLSCQDRPHESLLLLYAFPSQSLRRYIARSYTMPKLVAPSEPVTLPDERFRRGVYSLGGVVVGMCEALAQGFSLLRWEWWQRVANALMMLLVLLLCYQEEVWATGDVGPAVCKWVVRPVVEWVAVRGSKGVRRVVGKCEKYCEGAGLLTGRYKRVVPWMGVKKRRVKQY